jgi:hypothetical protein
MVFNIRPSDTHTHHKHNNTKQVNIIYFQSNSQINSRLIKAKINTTERSHSYKANSRSASHTTLKNHQCVHQTQNENTANVNIKYFQTQTNMHRHQQLVKVYHIH